jgi:putative oxidoreductase
MKKNIDSGLLILRLTLGVLMLFHGVAKITKGIEGIEDRLVEIGLPAFIALGVYVGEILAPVMMIIGYRTRIAAIIYAVNCLVALLLVHPDSIFRVEQIWWMGCGATWFIHLWIGGIDIYGFREICIVFWTQMGLINV